MSTGAIQPPVKWAAELAHVRDVSLFGTADLAFWAERLAKEDLVPAERHGQAQLLIVAAAARFMGIRFRELSVSVLVARPHDEARHEGAYLLGAFNSCRPFALVERVVFSTPYAHGDVRVTAAVPASIHLVKNGQEVFRAAMDVAAPPREPSRRGEEGWEGIVFLPERRRGPGRDGKAFFARLRGPTRTFPFLPAQDTLMIRPARGSEVLQALVDSRFVAREWAVRDDATHAKSKTYERAELLALVNEV